MKRFLIHVTTAWCGMDQDYTAIAEKEDDLWDLADSLAFENFSEFDCLQQIMEDENIDEDAAAEIEHDYYGSYVEEWDETRPEEEWDWYELVYDANDSAVEVEETDNEVWTGDKNEEVENANL